MAAADREQFSVQESATVVGDLNELLTGICFPDEETAPKKKGGKK